MEFILLLIFAAVLAWRLKPVKGIRTVTVAELKTILHDRD